jgi:hypothetical protein
MVVATAETMPVLAAMTTGSECCCSHPMVSLSDLCPRSVSGQLGGHQNAHKHEGYLSGTVLTRRRRYLGSATTTCKHRPWAARLGLPVSLAALHGQRGLAEASSSFGNSHVEIVVPP